jgi:peptidoglycan/xylan/chitin deacetylase (PgdA/CDA1 family)
MLAALKRSSFALSKQVGLNDFVAQTAWRRQRLLILCYHGISLDDEHVWNPGLYVSAARFERRLALLKRNDCTVLPLGEAVARLYRNDLPDRAVALTFDDGYYDFLARAWPLLSAYRYPATVYLTTARMDHNFPIVGLFVSYALWRARHRTLDATGVPGLDGTYPLTSIDDRRQVLRQLDATLRQLIASDKDAIAREIVGRLGFDYTELLATRALTLMRADEVRRLAGEGLDVQLHTHLHYTPEDPDLFVQDVLLNRARIEEITGRRPTHLCYPSGVYRHGYFPVLRQERIDSATTCDPGLASRSSDPLLLPRFIDTSMVTDVEFEAWITGLACCLPRRTTKAH